MTQKRLQLMQERQII